MTLIDNIDHNINNINPAIVLGKKDFMEGISSLGVYIVLAVIFLISFLSFYLVNEAAKQNVNIIYIIYNIGVEKSVILNIIFMFAVVFISFLYLGISSVTTISREKQEKTIEILFYSPMNELSFIAGKYLGKIFLYLYILSISVFLFVILNFIFPMEINLSFLKVVILSIFLISCVICGGIFLSTLTSSVSSSILILIGLSIALITLQIFGGIIAFIPADPESLLGIIKNTISELLSLTQYISPFSYLSMGWDAIGRSDDFKLILSIIYSTAYSLIFLFLSVITLIKKGVKQ